MKLKVQNNEIYLYGRIYEGDGAWFVQEFARLDGVHSEIELYLHTYGGSVFDGNMILNALVTARSQVNTNVIGVAASMGAILAQAGKVRRQVSNGFLMIHAASGSTWGSAKEHLSAANLLSEIEKQFVSLLTMRTGKAEKAVRKWLNGDNWFSAEQAKTAGLADEIIDPIASLETEINQPEKLGAQAVYERFAACLNINEKTEQKPNNLTENVTQMKQEVIKTLGLTGLSAQSSDTAVVAAIRQHVEAAVGEHKAKYEAEKAARENLEKTINEQQEARIKALLDASEASGKTTAQQRDLYEKIGKTSGTEALETVLGSLLPHKSIEVQNGGSRSATLKEGWDWDRYQKEDPKGLEALSKEDFNALYKAKFGTVFSDQPRRDAFGRK